MKSIIFHSFYDDPDLNSLKHSLLYFDKLYIPRGNFVIARMDPQAQSTSNAYLYNLLPGEVYDNIRLLLEENIIEIINVDEKKETQSVEQIAKYISTKLTEQTSQKKYPLSSLSPVFHALDFQSPNLYSDPVTIEIANNVLMLNAAFCLRAVAIGKKIPCVDHEIIFDSINIGLKSILSDKQVRNALCKVDLHDYKANFLAHKLFSLHLPSFEFRSFYDVLELKKMLQDELNALKTVLNNFALEIKGYPWEDNFQVHLQTFIDNKINPQIEDLKKKVKFSHLSFVKQLCNATRKNLSLVAFACGIFPEKLIEWMILGGAVSTLETIIGEYSARKEIENNGLSFFIKIQ